jgi:HEAT repeat protein
MNKHLKIGGIIVAVLLGVALSVLYLNKGGYGQSQCPSVRRVSSLAHDDLLEAWIVDLDSTNALKRSSAATNLRAAGRRAVPLLIRAASRDEGRRRSKAIFLLGQIGDTNACAALQQLYKSRVSLAGRDRAMLVTVLDELKGASLVSFFAGELEQERDPDVQFALAMALAQRGERSGVRHLLSRLEMPDGRRRKVAAWCLQRLFHEDLGDDPKRWEEWLKQHNKI